MPELIDAACQALIDGLDSPTLRELAGASPSDSSWDVRELADRALDELRIPRPGAVPAGHLVAAGGGVARRARIDALCLAVAPAGDDAGGGFQVQVFVNDAEMTSVGAGLGMGPYDLLIPTNRRFRFGHLRQVSAPSLPRTAAYSPPCRLMCGG